MKALYLALALVVALGSSACGRGGDDNNQDRAQVPQHCYPGSPGCNNSWYNNYNYANPHHSMYCPTGTYPVYYATYGVTCINLNTYWNTGYNYNFYWYQWQGYRALYNCDIRYHNSCGFAGTRCMPTWGTYGVCVY